MTDGSERQSLGPEPKALEALALLHTRFEQFNSDLAKVDKNFDKGFSRMLDEMDKVKEANDSWRYLRNQYMTSAKLTTVWHRTSTKLWVL